MAEGTHPREPHGHDRDQEGWRNTEMTSSGRSEFWSDVKLSLQEDLEKESGPHDEAEHGRGSSGDGHRGPLGDWPPDSREGDHPGAHRGWGRGRREMASWARSRVACRTRTRGSCKLLGPHAGEREGGSYGREGHGDIEGIQSTEVGMQPGHSQQACQGRKHQGSG